MCWVHLFIRKPGGFSGLSCTFRNSWLILVHMGDDGQPSPSQGSFTCSGATGSSSSSWYARFSVERSVLLHPIPPLCCAARPMFLWSGRASRVNEPSGQLDLLRALGQDTGKEGAHWSILVKGWFMILSPFVLLLADKALVRGWSESLARGWLDAELSCGSRPGSPESGHWPRPTCAL